MSSYHLIRTLLRTLGYPRFISMENFRIPNFSLMTDILTYLLKRFDSSLEINTKIDTEHDRLAFVRRASQLMVNKAHLDINTKNLYMADVNAVQEMIKLATLIQDAWRELNAKRLDLDEESPPEDVTRLADNTEFDRTIYNNFKTNQLTSEILQMGTDLFDLLSDYDQSKEQRQMILGKQLSVDQVEVTVRHSTQQLQEEIVDMQNQKESQDQDNDDLNEKIDRKFNELSRNRKRLQTLQLQRPVYMDELEKVEQDIIQLYDTYVVNCRCLFFLEQKLEEFEELEKLKLKERNEEIKQMLEQMRVDEFLKQGKDLKVSPSSDQLVNDDLAMMVDDDDDEGSEMSDGPGNRDGRKSGIAGRQKGAKGEKKNRSLVANTVTVRSGRRSAKTARIYSFGSLMENDDDDDDDDYESDEMARMSDSEIDLNAIDDTDDESLNSTEMIELTAEKAPPFQANSIADQMAKISFDKTDDDF